MSEIPTEPHAASQPEASVPPTVQVPADVPQAAGEVAAPTSADAAVPPASEAPSEAAPAAAAHDEPEALPAESAADESGTAAEAAADDGAPAAAGAPEDRGPGPAAVTKLLAERFPAVFAPGQAKPLKLKIQADIQARLETPVTRKVLSIVLQRHTTGTAYLRAMATATQRFDLDGQPAGELAEEHRQAAQVEVERRRAIVAGKREAERAAQREQQREQIRAQRQQQRVEQKEQRTAQAEAYVQREAEGAERAGRATLLRAFETTTLTRANFCALKGIAEADLEAVLALAREERAQRLAAVPRREVPPAQAGQARPAEASPPGERSPRGDRAPHGDRPPRGDRPQGPRPPRRDGRPPRRGPQPG